MTRNTHLTVHCLLSTRLTDDLTSSILWPGSDTTTHRKAPALPGLLASLTKAITGPGLPAAAAATTAVATAATAAAVATATTALLRLEAVAAVHGPVATRFERHMRVLATRRAGHGEHLAAATPAVAATTAAATAIAARSTAARTAPRLVRETLRMVEFLLARRKGERTPAIAAGKRFVDERHSTTS